MSDFSNDALDWITFKNQVWAGLEHNYTESISLRSDGQERPDRPSCASFERTSEDWRFVMRDQTAVVVPNANVSFVVYTPRQDRAVYGEPDDETVVSGESAADGANGQDQIEQVHEQSEHPGENISHGIDTPQPKRRGRPPKYPRPL